MPDPDLLRDDHKAIDKILDCAFAALEQGNGPRAFEYLDRFWARLAVHIRAEHLHLFPTLLKAGSDTSIEGVLARLRADHNFFMTELGSLIKQWRSTPNSMDGPVHSSLLLETKERLEILRKRLITHNEIEEKQVYPLVESGLSQVDRYDFSAKIRGELTNMPRRFSE